MSFVPPSGSCGEAREGVRWGSREQRRSPRSVVGPRSCLSHRKGGALRLMLLTVQPQEMPVGFSKVRTWMMWMRWCCERRDDKDGLKAERRRGFGGAGPSSCGQSLAIKRRALAGSGVQRRYIWVEEMTGGPPWSGETQWRGRD